MEKTNYDDLVGQLDYTSKEQDAKAMFDKLREHIGEKVLVTYYLYASKRKEEMELKEVDDFGSIETDSYIALPFVGYGTAITHIASENGETLYENPNIEDGYNRMGPEEISESAKLIFGDRIAAEMLKRTTEGLKEDSSSELVEQNEQESRMMR